MICRYAARCVSGCAQGFDSGPRLRREGTPPDVCKGRDDFLAALGLVELDGQEIVCAGLTPMSRLPRNRLTVSSQKESLILRYNPGLGSRHPPASVEEADKEPALSGGTADRRNDRVGRIKTAT